MVFVPKYILGTLLVAFVLNIFLYIKTIILLLKVFITQTVFISYQHAVFAMLN